MSLDVVWFKRDLRIHDHAPLAAAAASGDPVLCLYIIEPSLWAQPEMAGRHYAYLGECLASLDAALRTKGASLTIRVGEAVAVFADLHTRHGITVIRAHEETGLIHTYERDKAVRRWARRADIPLLETPQQGVIRGLKSRNGWARKWDQFMGAPCARAPARIRDAGLEREAIPGAETLGLGEDPCPQRQIGGRREAVETLAAFLSDRGRPYRRAMSSPVTAYEACSRVSAPLALGVLSMRETYQAARRALVRKRADADGAFAQSIDSFIARLHWHCHFMQKYEDDPEIERRDLHPAYRGVRPEPAAETVTAWIEGRTGFPLIDACMRALNATGWLNFRMRAMVAAFSSYHLWVHWREPAIALARRFTDFEPGIHYSQFQMQSGTTGVNTPRIYNPVKQSYDQDPDGVFIRKWVPELADLPTAFLHEPWRADDRVLGAAGVRLGETYPERLVDHLEAARAARAHIGAIRGRAEHRGQAAAIQHKHGSRKSGLRQTGSARSRAKAKKSQVGADQGRLDL